MTRPELIADVLGRQFDLVARQIPDEQVGVPTFLIDEFQQLAEPNPIEAFEIALRYLETRLPELPAEQLAEPYSRAYLLEVARWDIAGLSLLNPLRAQLAQILYSSEIRVIREVQDKANLRLHKGTPYHWLGYAYLFAQDPARAREYFLLAAVEDALLGDDWRASPAATVLAARWSSEDEYMHVEAMRRRAELHAPEVADLYSRNPELLLLEVGP